MKPHFIWIGQGKSGSSLSFNVLARHPLTSTKSRYLRVLKSGKVLRDQIGQRLTGPLQDYVTATFGRTLWAKAPARPTYPTATPQTAAHAAT